MRTIIAGSRDCTDIETLYIALQGVTWGMSEIVSGGCRGVDLLGEEFARRCKLPIKRFPYESKYGKAGGPIRNRKMANYSDALIALWDGKSAGTKNMIEEAHKKSLLVYIYML